MGSAASLALTHSIKELRWG